MVKSILIPYLGCRIKTQGREKVVYMDSYFIRLVTPVNVSLLIYPYEIIKNYIVETPSSRNIILENTENCRSLLEYIIDIYRDLKSESLKMFKRMYWYNVSNLLVPVRFSPLARDRINQYERLVGEFTASVMLLDRILGKNVLREDYVVEDYNLKYIRLFVSKDKDNVVFSDGILGRVYTKLYETDEKFRKEINKIIDF